MCDLTHLTSLSRGARFYRADMHIHSFGPRTGSHDVKDSTMTPEAIVQTAAAENLDIIAITDHNEIGNVEAAIAAAGTDLLVVPGVELSTPQGHLLCYLSDLEALRGFYSRLKIADRGMANSRCQQALLECLTAAHEFRGFGVSAHVDAPKGCFLMLVRCIFDQQKSYWTARVSPEAIPTPVPFMTSITFSV